MKYKLFFLFLLFSCLGFQSSKKAPLSARIANYDIQVKLDVEQKKLIAHTKLTWKNTSADTVSDLQFHLYYNAFKNSETTFFSERGLPSLFKTSLQEDCNWSWVEIQNMTDNYGNDLAAKMHYIQPDDDNKSDQTVLRVPLPRSVLPNETIEVEFDWIGKIPKTMIRTGYNKDFYFMAQWYPKVGVYEPAGMRYAEKGGWNCHQYHSSGEYYGEFGNYNIAMTVPENYIVGSSGTQPNPPKNNGDQTSTWTFEVDDVIDFAWGASPHFVENKMDWKGIEIRLLTYPEHVHFKERYFSILPQALEFFEENFEKYPYPSLTIIAPPFHGLYTGGMEYPTLITTLNSCLLPTGIRSTEILTVHEFVHQYFQQIVATNEMEEAWMDEGITNFYEGVIMDKIYGEKSSTIDFMGIKTGNAESDRVSYFNMKNPAIAPNSLNSWEFPAGSYHTIQYSKSAVWLNTLKRIVGEETFKEAMKTYYSRWKFKHPSAKDFVNVINEVVAKNHPVEFGDGMDWFFQQVLYGTEICDYAVSSISNDHKVTSSGIFDNLDECEQSEMAKNENDEPIFKSSVVVERLGDMTMPMEILIWFEYGHKVVEQWDGTATMKEFSYEGTRKIVCAEIDPQHKIFLDKNFLNNSYTSKPNLSGVRKYVNEFMFWMQNAMEGLGVLI